MRFFTKYLIITPGNASVNSTYGLTIALCRYLFYIFLFYTFLDICQNDGYDKMKVKNTVPSILSHQFYSRGYSKSIDIGDISDV